MTPGLGLDTLNRIVMDIMLGVSPERSRLTYTPDMLAQRKRLEKQIADRPPGTIVDLPSE